MFQILSISSKTLHTRVNIIGLLYTPIGILTIEIPDILRHVAKEFVAGIGMIRYLVD
jgi:hypothetical protein